MADDTVEEEHAEPPREESGLRSSRRARLIVASTIVGMIALAGVFVSLWSGRQPSTGAGVGAGPAATMVDVVNPKPTMVVVSMTHGATTITTPDAVVSPKQAGYLRQVRVKQGAKVKAGEVLAVLQLANDKASQAQDFFQSVLERLKTAQLQYKIAQDTLAISDADVGSDKAKLAQAKSSLASAQSALKKAQTDLPTASKTLQDRNASLKQGQDFFGRGIISADELQKIRSAQADASSQVDDIRTSIQSAQAGQSAASESVKSAEEALRADTAQAERARAALVAAGNAVKSLQTVAGQAGSTAEAAQRNKQLVSLVAPANGVVLGVPAAVDSLVIPGMEIAIIKPTGAAVVAFDVGDDVAQRVKTGMPASVQFGKAGQALNGRVVAVPPTTDGGANRNRVIVEVRDPKDSLKPGTNVNVKVFLGKSAALFVPKEALASAVGTPSVWVVENGTATSRQVNIAEYGRYTVSVDKGLRPTDAVVVASNGTVLEGSLVGIRSKR